MVTLIWTYQNFHGTFKCHESHSNKHPFECFRPGMAKYGLCNHFYNHKYHYESIACLGVEIRLQIKKLWCKRCFCTVCQESFFCVWHEKQMCFVFKTGFLQCCKVFSVIFFYYEIPRKNYHDNIWSLLQGKQPQYRLKCHTQFVTCPH